MDESCKRIGLFDGTLGTGVWWCLSTLKVVKGEKEVEILRKHISALQAQHIAYTYARGHGIRLEILNRFINHNSTPQRDDERYLRQTNGVVALLHNF